MEREKHVIKRWQVAQLKKQQGLWQILMQIRKILNTMAHETHAAFNFSPSPMAQHHEKNVHKHCVSEKAI